MLIYLQENNSVYYTNLVQVLLDNCAIINNKEIRIAYEKCHTNIVTLLIKTQEQKVIDDREAATWRTLPTQAAQRKTCSMNPCNSSNIEPKSLLNNIPLLNKSIIGARLAGVVDYLRHQKRDVYYGFIGPAREKGQSINKANQAYFTQLDWLGKEKLQRGAEVAFTLSYKDGKWQANNILPY